MKTDADYLRDGAARCRFRTDLLLTWMHVTASFDLVIF